MDGFLDHWFQMIKFQISVQNFIKIGYVYKMRDGNKKNAEISFSKQDHLNLVNKMTLVKQLRALILFCFFV